MSVREVSGAGASALCLSRARSRLELGARAGRDASPGSCCKYRFSFASASLYARDKQNLGLRIELADEHVALLCDVCREPSLGYLLIEFFFDLFETLRTHGLRVPFRAQFF